MPDSPSMQSLIFLYGPVLESSHGTISSISLITGLALFGWVENITFLSILQLISAAQLHCPLPLFSIVLFFFFWQTYSPLCCCSANANFSWLPYWENVRLDYVLFISYFRFCLYFQWSFQNVIGQFCSFHLQLHTILLS